MTREEFFQQLSENYETVAVLSRKQDRVTLHLRHRALGQDLVFRSFPRECDAFERLCGIRCENLPEIFDAVLCDDGMAVLEEYIDGISLSQHMEIERYTYKSAKKVLRPLLFALSVLHERGLIHRDVKPENAMLGKDGRVVLIDFDASRSVKNTKRDTQILGTVGYAAPEQMGIAQSDIRTDIYAIGILLNVLITGAHPSKKLAKGKAGKIVRKCTAVNPADRYQTAQELWKAL